MDELTPEERGDKSLSFFHRHRTKILTGSLATIAVAASSFAVQKAFDAVHDAESSVKKVKVIERNSSNCIPKKGETVPRRPALCKAGFDKAVQLISPYQACQISAKGAPLMVVNGEKVKTIECIQPAPKQHGSSEISEQSTSGQSRPRRSQSSAKIEGSSPQHHQTHKKSQPQPHSPESTTPVTAPEQAAPPPPPTDNGQGKNKGNHGEGTGTEGPKGNASPGQAAQGLVENAGKAVGKVLDETCTLLDQLANLCDPS